MNTDNYNTPTPDNNSPHEFTFNWIPLAVAALFLISGKIPDWTFLLVLSIVVIIHEMGHVVLGRYFGCQIEEMQVFFFAFISYKPREVAGSNAWWRRIKWSLGVLPWGGFTVFKTRSDYDDYPNNLPDTEEYAAASPYLNDKPASQRLLISAGGVMFNLATFLALYAALTIMPADVWFNFCYPIALMSLILAVLNILPIYPLDGGAILFAAYEIATGSRPSPGFVNVCGTVGFVLIILLFWVFPEWINRLLNMVVHAAF